MGKYNFSIRGAPEFHPRYEPQRLAKPDTTTSILFCILGGQIFGVFGFALVFSLPTRSVEAREGTRQCSHLALLYLNQTFVVSLPPPYSITIAHTLFILSIR